MAVDITALVGVENMKPEAKAAVIALLKAMDQPATTKRYMYSRWARVVGVQPTKEDLDSVALWSQN
jgi:hypothetical protein